MGRGETKQMPKTNKLFMSWEEAQKKKTKATKRAKTIYLVHTDIF